MNQHIAINKLSVSTGITSRTLRYWESEGLFKSGRDPESGWRIYDKEAVTKIQLISLLRSLEISLKEIKKILEDSTVRALESALKKKLVALGIQRGEVEKLKVRVEFLLGYLSEDMNPIARTYNELEDLVRSGIKSIKKGKSEVNKMTTIKANRGILFISLPNMRMVTNIVVGVSPEDDAIEPVVEWLQSNNLTGTAKLYGGNIKPYPSEKKPEYGYGMMASIPEGISIPDNFEEVRFIGGVYACMDSDENISMSWKKFMDVLSEDDRYVADHSRLCLEEHIRNDNPNGSGSKYNIRLLEAVKLK